MTLTIDLTPETEAQLRRLAKERGMDVETFAQTTLTQLAEQWESIGDEKFERIAQHLLRKNAELFKRLA